MFIGLQVLLKVAFIDYGRIFYKKGFAAAQLWSSEIVASYHKSIHWFVAAASASALATVSSPTADLTSF